MTDSELAKLPKANSKHEVRPGKPYYTSRSHLIQDLSDVVSGWNKSELIRDKTHKVLVLIFQSVHRLA